MLPKDNQEVYNKKTKYSLDIQNVTKSFLRKTLQKGGYTTLKSLLLHPLKHEKASSNDYIHVIKNLSLQIPRGKSVGIIGRNGAGKSTLLKLISGIYQPTSGTVKVNGKIAALIELGAGFHPDFSGRENIYLGGAMHGMTREEIDSVFDDIVKFSELEEFIDAPIRTYSSGMYMRLGFSLAIHTSPDILIIDEVLAVGDASFTAKCKDKLFDIRKNGTTLLLVSHDLSSIEEWCDEAIWIEKGSVKSRGVPKKVIDEYLDFLNIRDSEKIKEINDIENNKDSNKNIAKNLLKSTSDDSLKNVSNGNNNDEDLLELSNVKCFDENNNECYAFKTNDKLIIKFDYLSKCEIKDAILEIRVTRSDGFLISESSTKLENIKVTLKKQGFVSYKINDLNLLPARYVVSITVRKSEKGYYAYKDNAINFLVRSGSVKSGLLYLKHEWSIL